MRTWRKASERRLPHLHYSCNPNIDKIHQGDLSLSLLSFIPSIAVRYFKMEPYFGNILWQMLKRQNTNDPFPHCRGVAPYRHCRHVPTYFFLKMPRNAAAAIDICVMYDQIHRRRKVYIRVSLCGMLMLIRVDTLRRVHNVDFLTRRPTHWLLQSYAPGLH